MQTIFLSYAHDDNRAPSAKQQGWVTHFDNSLDIELVERGLKNITFWRDTRDLDQMGVLDDKLVQGVSTADLFVAVLSPLYAVQNYCKFELSQFFKSKIDAGHPPPSELVLLILKRPLRDDQYPPEIRGLTYLPFFEIDRESNDPKPFFDGFGDEISPRYWESIRKVGSLIEKRLTVLKGRKVASADDEEAARPTVYLAEAGSDLSIAHWNIRTELESQGCRIVPSEPWPKDAAAARTHLADALAKADFSIHLLGTQPGRATASGLDDLAVLQLDLAAARAADGEFRRLIWVPPDLPKTAQPELIASLDDGNRLGPHDELVRSGLESFKEVVRDELTKHAADAAPPARLYLICAHADEAEALALRPALTAAGFDVEFPEFGANGLVPADEHQRCLRDCDGVLVLWGSETESGTKKRIDDANNAVATLRQNKPFTVRALYLAPPPSSRKATFASRQIDLIVHEPAGLSQVAAFAARKLAKGKRS